MIVTTLPQDIQEIKVISIKDLIRVLPETIEYKVNVWIADKLARYGLTTENLIFLAECDEPSVEMREYFNKLVEPLGINATVRGDWKNREWSAIRLYNEGSLIIDKKTMAYKCLPTPVHTAPIITLDDLKSILPEEIPFKETLHLTGGLVKNGFTCNDVDFLAFDVEDKTLLGEMADYFTETLGIKTDVGNKIMPEREPVYCYKMYEGGKCLQ
jgi:hypothetical protein